MHKSTHLYRPKSQTTNRRKRHCPLTMSTLIKSGATAAAVGVDLAFAGTGVNVFNISGYLNSLAKRADV